MVGVKIQPALFGPSPRLSGKGQPVAGQRGRGRKGQEGIGCGTVVDARTDACEMF